MDDDYYFSPRPDEASELDAAYADDDERLLGNWAYGGQW